MFQVVDLKKMYKATFGIMPYSINAKGSNEPVSQEASYSGVQESNRSRTSIDYTLKQIALNKKSAYGLDIWFPCEFWQSDKKALEIDACTIGVHLSKNIIRTSVSERKGTVKEQFSIDDYRFTIKGFLIGTDRFFPEEKINKLKELFETTEPISLHGGYPELFLDESCRIVISALDFPEVQGKSPWIRPFNLTCESDFVQDLIIQ